MMKENNFKVNKSREGDYISRISYCKLLDIGSNISIIENEFGAQWNVGNKVLDRERCNSATYYESEEKVSRTKLVEVLEEVGDTVFSVTYNKKPKEDDITKTLEGLNAGKFPTKAEIKKRVKEVYKGKEKTTIGYRIGKTDLGRILMIDLEKKQDPSKNYETRMVSVDTRTVTMVINKNVKYVLK